MDLLLHLTQLSLIVPTFDGNTHDLICLTESGLLVHCFNGRLVKCLNLMHHFPGNGKVSKLELFFPSWGRRCLCVFQERVCLVFDIGDENDTTFLLRHQVKMKSTKMNDVMAYDFLGKGSQQLLLKVSKPGRSSS